jgi:hypothetical protein
MRTLPTGQTQRSDRPSSDERGTLIATANRTQFCNESNVLARSEFDSMRAWLGSGARCPGVANLTAEASVTRILDDQHGIDGLAKACRRLAESGAVQFAGAGRQDRVDDDRRDQRRKQDYESGCGPRQNRDRQHADQRDEADAAGKDH